MRRHLILALLTLAVVAVTGSTAFAQYVPPYQQPYQQQYEYRPYEPQYQQPQYQQQYQQPYSDYRPYEQRAQRGGLRIVEAWYGRNRRVCDASHALRATCEGRGNCAIKAGNELCGDPLPNVVKGLAVTYRCHGQTYHVDEMESRHLGLRCD